MFLAVVPFGFVLVAESRQRLRTIAGFVTPLAMAIGLTGLYNALRFGSLVESGYAISELSRPELAQRRAQGVISLRHLADNLGLFMAGGFDVRGRFPYLVPDRTVIRSC